MSIIFGHRLDLNLVRFLITRFSLEGNAAMWVYVCGVFVTMAAAYFLGSVDFAVLFSKKLYSDDVRTHGSGNAGTTNMLRTYGKKAAILTLLCDMGKALVAMVLGYAVDPIFAMPVAGLFVILGHMFPIYYKFKGGKGVACAAIVVLLMNPYAFLILFAAFIIVILATRYVSAASVTGMLLLPLTLNAFKSMDELAGGKTLAAVVIGVLVIFMHRENMKRLFEGKESKLSFGKKDAASKDEK